MKKKIKLKKIPVFQNEDEEREFWWNHDSTEYVDYSKKNRVTIEFDSSYEPPVKLISIRLPREMINQLKCMAIKRDVPYQSLIKMILAERLEQKVAAGRRLLERKDLKVADWEEMEKEMLGR